MWFKNLQLYRLHAAPVTDAGALEQALSDQKAQPLGRTQARRIGWVAPAGRLGTGHLVHELQGQRLISALRQERLLPGSVVAEEVADQVAEIEAREGRKLTRKEKAALKEQVTEALLPQAFVRSQRIDVWWDAQRNLIGVNTSSRSRAEDVLDLLRETLGSLKVTPLVTQALPVRAMTTWLGDADARPSDLILGDSVVLSAKGDDGILRGRQLDLDSGEVQQLLASGRQSTQLALGIEGKLSFVMHDDLALKQLRFGDALIEQADHADDCDDALVRLETDFVLMAQALGDSVDRIIEWLGGEAGRGAITTSAEDAA